MQFRINESIIILVRYLRKREVKNMGLTVEEMQTNIIRRYGFEHPTTIRFFQYCEKESDLGCIQLVYEFDIDE